MDAWLQTNDGRRFPLAGAGSIGRLPENTVALNDPGVSRRHALIHAHGQSGYWLVDFGSRNGVMLNRRRLTEPMRVNDGDQIEIAGHRLIFHEQKRPQKNSRADSAVWRTTESLTETFVPVGHGVILLAPDGKVRSISGHAQEWLEVYFQKLDGELRLPAELEDWLQRQRPVSKHKSSSPAREIFSVEKNRKRLSVKIAEESPDQLLLLLTEHESIFSPPLLARLGLTEREGEVLHWLAEGKSNPEIAIILGASPRTVGKHVEHIFEKLGVESRTAALLCVMEILGKI
jgi:DNA-binding CsgD family transcriptional regulator/pSer/pThr/pTyr-binding forkhead associated (FHA) protein